jgi:C_GCAxxG_C_C family probable redox protein
MTMARIESAVSQFSKGFSCSQAVLSTYGPEFGLDEVTALRLGAAFGGGMGRMADTCGAVTGAFMVLGLKHGTTVAGDREGKEQTYQQVREFVQRFRARCGSIVCRDLLEWDISTPEGIDEAKERGLLTTLCPRFVQIAAEILEEMLPQRGSFRR